MSHTHDAPVDKSTINGGLGLTQSCFDAIGKDCVQAYKDQDSISDTLLVSGNQIRQEELAVPGNLSRYEKKLLLAGYFVGKIHADLHGTHQAMTEMMKKMIRELDEDSMPETIKKMIRELGEEKSKDEEGED